MADERQRQLERQASQGDANAQAHLIAARLRSGMLARERVELAAHLNDPVATQMSAEPLPGFKCSCGGLRACMRCGGTGTRPLPTDLVPFVRSAQVPADVLREWVCDCAEHVITFAPEVDREPLRNVINRARALAPELRSFANAVAEAPANERVNRVVQLLVSAAEFQRSLAPPERWRMAFAGVVTMAYRAAGNTQAERGWQIQALARRLLA